MPKISIDKLSITARLDDFEDSSLSEYLNRVPYLVEYRHMPWNFIYQHQYDFKESGLFVQIGDYEQEKVFRLEFNPNKLEKQYLTFYFNIIKRIKFPNVTRIDWAVDYEEDMSQYNFRQLTSRKTIEYRSRSGKLETLYHGSLKSDKFTRIYNKALEKKRSRLKLVDEDEEISVKEVLWRVESVVKNFEVLIEKEIEKYIEHDEGVMTIDVPRKWLITGVDESGRQICKEYDLKPEKREVKGLVKVKKKEKVGYDYIFDNPFKNLEIYKKYEGGSDGLKQNEKAMLFFLKYNPDEWDKMSPNTRKKYEQLTYLYDWMLIDNQPSEVFEQEKNRLAEELESWLKPALDKSHFKIGFKSNIYYSLEYLKEQNKKVE